MYIARLLRAVGATDVQVRSSVMMEAVFLGMVGAAMGVLAGSILSGVAVQATAGDDSRTLSVVYPVVQAAAYAAAAVLLAALAAVVPARSAGRVPVVQALRSE